VSTPTRFITPSILCVRPTSPSPRAASALLAARYPTSRNLKLGHDPDRDLGTLSTQVVGTSPAAERGEEAVEIIRSVQLQIHEWLNSVSAFQGTLISSKSRVYLLMDRDPVGQSASRSVGFSKWIVLIGQTGFDAISSIPDPTLSLRVWRFVFLSDPAQIRSGKHKQYGTFRSPILEVNADQFAISGASSTTVAVRFSDSVQYAILPKFLPKFSSV